jgi:uncharacterized membrane protein
MANWFEFVAALLVFLAAHAIPMRPPIRARLVAVLGARGFTFVYSVLSLALLGWLFAAAARAPYVEVWPIASLRRWAPNIAMPIVCLLLAFSIGAPNPLSFGGARNDQFDPERPQVIVRHPLLWSLALWALAHLVPNGDLAHVIMFGLLGAFAFAGMYAIDRRKRRQLGGAQWRALARNTALWPRISAFKAPRFSMARLGAAVAIYFALLFLHAPVIGVEPWAQ